MDATDAKALTVGKRVRWARKRADLTLDQLAEQMGTTRQAIIRWEQNTNLPNERSRERLGKATDLHPDFFKDESRNGHAVDEDEEALQRKAREFVAPFQRDDGRGADGGVSAPSRASRRSR